jgi:hypothetical protein
MKTSKIITISIFLALTISFGVPAMNKMPGPDPKELWQHITKTSDYTKWDFWPDHKGMLPGMEPHGSQHKVYVNDIALNSSHAPLEYGSIQVKENYNNANKLMAITVMYKVKGYNPEDGDWFWVRYKPSGKAKPYGKPKGCVGCHSANASNDYIFVHDIK